MRSTICALCFLLSIISCQKKTASSIITDFENTVSKSTSFEYDIHYKTTVSTGTTTGNHHEYANRPVDRGACRGQSGYYKIREFCTFSVSLAGQSSDELIGSVYDQRWLPLSPFL